MSKNMKIFFLEQAISLVESLLESIKVDKKEEVEKVLSLVLDLFEISEKSISTIKNQLNKTPLKNSIKEIDLDRADSLMLEALILKSSLKYDKEKVNFEDSVFDFEYLYTTLTKKLKSEKKKVEAEKRKAAIKKLQSEGKDINAKNLSEAADISVEEAEKYLGQLAKIQQARKVNPKLENKFQIWLFKVSIS